MKYVVILLLLPLCSLAQIGLDKEKLITHLRVTEPALIYDGDFPDSGFVKYKTPVVEGHWQVRYYYFKDNACVGVTVLASIETLPFVLAQYNRDFLSVGEYMWVDKNKTIKISIEVNDRVFTQHLNKI